MSTLGTMARSLGPSHAIGVTRLLPGREGDSRRWPQGQNGGD